MLTRLHAELNGDARAIREVVERLSTAQRAGLRPLQSPLPLVPAIVAIFDGLVLSARDRDLLLALAVSLDDALEAVLAFDGRSASEIAGSELVGRHLVVRAGRIRLTDPRTAIWLRARTEPAVIGAVHDRLSRIFQGRGDQVSADWHRARAALDRDPAAAAELTRIARELSEAGHPSRALLLAREAAAHAVGEELDEAMLVAGASSVGAGFAAEAAEWLGRLFPDGTERYRLQGLAGLIIARAHLQGAVPAVDPNTLRPRSDDRDDWYSWTRAAAVAAVLCAERDDRGGMRAWLDAVRTGSRRVGAERELADPVTALSWLLVGETDVDEATGSGPLSGRMLRALRAAIDDDVDLGLRILGAAEAMDAEIDPLVAGFEYSPVVGAYRAVVEVLLLVWRGDIGTARARMLSAACELPIAMPFAGLGVVLARRLDLAVLGKPGPVSRALTASLPPGTKIDVIVDRGIEAFLAGDFDGAASSMRLWLELGAPQTAFAVPGLDEVALTWEIGPASQTMIAPPEVLLAHELRLRAATVTDGRWWTEREEVHASARTLRSPFARARIEAMLGVRCAIRGEGALARRHLQTARHLFELAGATAWARSIGDRMARLDPDRHDAEAPADPLSSCRHAWAQLLTARELEVAMLAVGGAANRDIAAALNVSVRTVEVHLGRVFAKLDVRRRVELTALAHRTDQYL